MTRTFTVKTFSLILYCFVLFFSFVIQTVNAAYINCMPGCNLNGQMGISASTGLAPNMGVPEKLHGGRLALWYAPCSLCWRRMSLYFDASYAYWRVYDRCANRIINVYAIAPIFRYYFLIHPQLSPFFEISVGPAFLTKTHLAKRNLGLHFTFQDQGRIGIAWGTFRQFSASLGFIHYSNASICSHNSGISVPLVLNLDYRF